MWGAALASSEGMLEAGIQNHTGTDQGERDEVL